MIALIASEITQEVTRDKRQKIIAIKRNGVDVYSSENGKDLGGKDLDLDLGLSDRIKAVDMLSALAPMGASIKPICCIDNPPARNNIGSNPPAKRRGRPMAKTISKTPSKTTSKTDTRPNPSLDDDEDESNLDQDIEINVSDIEPIVDRSTVERLTEPSGLALLDQGEAIPVGSIQDMLIRWGRYLDCVRKVSRNEKGEEVKSLIAVRKLSRLTGVSISTIKGISLGPGRKGRPDVVPTQSVRALAAVGSISEYELRSYITYGVFNPSADGISYGFYQEADLPSNRKDHSMGSEVFLTSYLSDRSLNDLADILKIVADMVQIRIQGGDMINLRETNEELEERLNEANEHLLNLLDDFQDARDLTDKEFESVCSGFKISIEEIESLENNERPTIKLVGNIARMTGASIDDLMAIVNRSYPPSS